ncbi:MAG: HAD family hydrolase [Ardenticatenaceae bacterium]|nr:HAD family hydrolase [Anaerolineales bacterium]MCB8923761.1 HAD family hydrolase [Ardenticatenaceae bacterium]MCB8990096.1 HAD family hydrolase [Ardenticatenaceae bacterium]
MTNSPLLPALFLDRDGVIIENRANYVRSWADVEIYPQAVQALARIRHTPFKIILVTNQSAVGRGIITLEMAQAINKQLLAVMAKENCRIDDVFLCPHAPQDGCDCRKPQPGLLLQAAQKHGIDLSRSMMIGDALTDMQAGLAAGVQQTILLRTGRGAAQLQKPEAAQFHSMIVHDSLETAVQALINTLLLPPT